MKAIIIDIIILAILGISVWRGAKKGMIMTLSGLVILICAFAFSGYAADKLSPYIQAIVDPFIGGIADRATSTAIRDTMIDDLESPEYVKDVAVTAFSELGIWDKSAEAMGHKISEELESVEDGIRRAVSDAFSNSVAYFLAYIIAFTVIILAVALIANMLDLAFKLPGLDLLNKFGGMGLGFIYGLALVFALGWIIRYFGALIGAETINKTILLKFFISVNPFAAVFR